MTTVIMRTTARVVIPIVLVVAISLLLQGHDLPGGGFIGGVLTVAGFTLIYVAYDLDYLERGILDREVESVGGVFELRSVSTYHRLFAGGLVLTVASGLGALLFGEPFLDQTILFVHLPLLGEVELATALVFDVGIFCVVVGAMLVIFSVVGAE